MAKQGQKLTDELKEKIKAHLASGGNIRETAREFGVSPSTVKKIKEEEPDEFERLRTEKREEMIDVIYEDMKDALALGRQKIKLAKAASENFERLVDKLTDALRDANANPNDVMTVLREVSAVMNIPLGQISTYFGTLYDKRALMKGDSTSNTVTKITLDGDLDVWAN